MFPGGQGNFVTVSLVRWLGQGIARCGDAISFSSPRILATIAVP